MSGVEVKNGGQSQTKAALNFLNLKYPTSSSSIIGSTFYNCNKQCISTTNSQNISITTTNILNSYGIGIKINKNN